MHIDDDSLMTDALVDYIHRAHTWSQEFIEAPRKSVSLPQSGQVRLIVRRACFETRPGCAGSFLSMRLYC